MANNIRNYKDIVMFLHFSYSTLIAIYERMPVHPNNANYNLFELEKEQYQILPNSKKKNMNAKCGI
ncbi:MAG: hypothetical protein ACTHKF_08095 [Candidatus Nitrosocosmicus sp.]